MPVCVSGRSCLLPWRNAGFFAVCYHLFAGGVTHSESRHGAGDLVPAPSWVNRHKRPFCPSSGGEWGKHHHQHFFFPLPASIWGGPPPPDLPGADHLPDSLSLFILTPGLFPAGSTPSGLTRPCAGGAHKPPHYVQKQGDRLYLEVVAMAQQSIFHVEQPSSGRLDAAGPIIPKFTDQPAPPRPSPSCNSVMIYKIPTRRPRSGHQHHLGHDSHRAMGARTPDSPLA